MSSRTILLDDFHSTAKLRTGKRFEIRLRHRPTEAVFGALRDVDLELPPVARNREINDRYATIAEHFQAILDPRFRPGGTSRLLPSWFAFGVYASREVGRSLQAAEHAIAMADLADRGGDSVEAALARAGISGRAAAAIGKAFHASFSSSAQTALAALSFLVHYLKENARLLTETPGAIEQLLDPRYLMVATKRLVALLGDAPGDGLAEKLEAVARTLRDALGEGNRLIFADIGRAGHAYLRWREALARRPSPERVLAEFSLAGSSPARARAIYEQAVALRGADFDDFDQRFSPARYDGHDFVVAAFALYELAGREPRSTGAAQAVVSANKLLAWREQRDSARPAFAPGTRPGEVDRYALFAVLTPWVRLPLKDSAWAFAPFASEHLERRDWNPLTPRASEYNWAELEHRWPGIVDAFEQAYIRPHALWPMPADASAV